MNTKLYVGNLSYETTQNDLEELFGAHGPVNEVNVIMDKITGRPRGFAFVVMATPEGAKSAIEALSGRSIGGRALTVNEARPREERSGGFGGGGGYGGGGGGGGRREYSR